MLMGSILLVVSFAFLATPSFAEAAAWVLIAPPRDKNGDYIRNGPVNGSWTQIAAFDNAAQCEQQRDVEIDTWKHWIGMPEGEMKRWFQKTHSNEFLIRCMPYDLWWRAQQPSP